MSDTAKRPRVTRFFVRDAVHFGGTVKNSLSAGDMGAVIERTASGVLVKYEQPDGKGQKAKHETFIPDSNMTSIDLETTG